MKRDTVNFGWVLRLSTLFAKIVQKMKTCEVKCFFTRVEEFLKEYDTIKYFIPDDDFLKKITDGPFVCNRLFHGLIMSRLYGPKKAIPLYLEDMVLYQNGGLGFPEWALPMEEKYFWALWYALTVSPHKRIVGQTIQGGKIEPLDKTERYHFCFDSTDGDGDKFGQIFHVVFEFIDNKWNYTANSGPLQFSIAKSMQDGKNRYFYLMGKEE